MHLSPTYATSFKPRGIIADLNIYSFRLHLLLPPTIHQPSTLQHVPEQIRVRPRAEHLLPGGQALPGELLRSLCALLFSLCSLCTLLCSRCVISLCSSLLKPPNLHHKTLFPPRWSTPSRRSSLAPRPSASRRPRASSWRWRRGSPARSWSPPPSRRS